MVKTGLRHSQHFDNARNGRLVPQRSTGKQPNPSVRYGFSVTTLRGTPLPVSCDPLVGSR